MVSGNLIVKVVKSCEMIELNGKYLRVHPRYYKITLTKFQKHFVHHRDTFLYIIETSHLYMVDAPLFVHD